ncbi:MAG: hypothetical protein V9G04_15280 [Nocardioides sp.]
MSPSESRNAEQGHLDSSGGGVIERFSNGSAWVTGGFLLAIGAALVTTAALERDDVDSWVGALGALAIVVAWIWLLRPRAYVTTQELVLRNPLSTVRIPLAAVEELVVRHYLAVRAGERRFTSAAVGRTLGNRLRHPRPTGDLNTAEGLANAAYGDYVEHRLRGLASDAREREGIALMSPEQDALAATVQRSWAWPELVALVAAAVAFVVLL